ncbi:MAG: HisA/HisF-related TIM barrel protein [Burkholderiales bacterium]
MRQADAALRVCCLGPAGEGAPGVPRFAFDGDPSEIGSLAGIVLVRKAETRAKELLQAGASKVFIGAAALKDPSLIGRLAAEFGTGRIGLYATAARMEVSWALDTVCNADFRFMMPSRCEPCLEILDATGSRTGTELGGWIAEMAKLGASSVLLCADARDGSDLNLVAGLAEQYGERLWIGPLEDAEPPLADWIEHAGVRQLALPHALLERVHAA